MNVMTNIFRNASTLFAAVFVVLGLAVAGPAPEVAAADPPGKCAQNTNTIAFLPRWYEGLCKTPDGKTLLSPADMSGANTGEKLGRWLSVIGLNIVTIILYIVGYVSLFFIIWGGFKYMTQGDNSSGTVAARKTIQNAIIGLVLSIMSVAIVQFIVGNIK